MSESGGSPHPGSFAGGFVPAAGYYRARPVEGYRLWIDADRLILLRVWGDGTMELATREQPEGTWGPPVRLHEEEIAT